MTIGERLTAEEVAASVLSDVLKAAITSGAVVASWATVEVSKDASPNGQALSQNYIKLEAQSGAGMAAIVGKVPPATPKPKEGKDERTEEQKADGACDFFNYGYDLNKRAPIRQKLVEEAKGPETAVKRFATQLIAADYAKDDVISTILNSPKYKDSGLTKERVEAILATIK